MAKVKVTMVLTIDDEDETPEDLKHILYHILTEYDFSEEDINTIEVEMISD